LMGEAREMRKWPAAGAGRKGRAALEVEEGVDMWAPPVGDRVREREGSGALGRVGRKWNWAAAGLVR
jgi:DNA-binding Lrp family transcriptional regulator